MLIRILFKKKIINFKHAQYISAYLNIYTSHFVLL